MALVIPLTICSNSDLLVIFPYTFCLKSRLEFKPGNFFLISPLKLKNIKIDYFY